MNATSAEQVATPWRRHRAVDRRDDSRDAESQGHGKDPRASDAGFARAAKASHRAAGAKPARLNGFQVEGDLSMSSGTSRRPHGTARDQGHRTPVKPVAAQGTDLRGYAGRRPSAARRTRLDRGRLRGSRPRDRLARRVAAGPEPPQAAPGPRRPPRAVARWRAARPSVPRPCPSGGGRPHAPPGARARRPSQPTCGRAASAPRQALVAPAARHVLHHRRLDVLAAPAQACPRRGSALPAAIDHGYDRPRGRSSRRRRGPAGARSRRRRPARRCADLEEGSRA